MEISLVNTIFQFIEIGKVVSIENNHKAVDKATRGMEVCIKIEAIPGDSPKMFGRHFDETDLLYSKVIKFSGFYVVNQSYYNPLVKNI